ncbi:MAG: FtsQ-type POTRA domain-containing protein [Beijerinckiaceae bacterium]|nr:FtsQ-type POTRA domain-containing protein [Beijerinckiaceae bacterium]
MTGVPSERRGTKAPVRWPKPGLPGTILSHLAKPGASACFALALLASVGAYGALKGGHYAAYVAKEGEPADILARAFGFAIKAVTVSGTRELREQDILSAAGIEPRNSLLFLDAAQVRERLKRLPLVKDAAVTKLYPGSLLINIEERQPYALWQNGGDTRIVAADGVPLAPLRGRRFIHLPLVAGAGANEKLRQYMAILDAAGHVRERIAAGVLVSGRRWTLKTATGIEILLPEIEPEAAMTRFADFERTYHLFDKDVLSFDLRQPGRLAARLSEEAAAGRASLLTHKAKAKGGRT